MSKQPQSLRIAYRSLQGEVVNRLRDEIVGGTWKPGERLQERLLCQRFGISRSPLREALQVLASEGLLELFRNRGAIASSLSISDILQNFALLETLEILAIGLACENASDAEIAAIVAKHDEIVVAERTRDEATAFRLNNALHQMIVLACHNRPVIDTHLIVQRRIIRAQNVYCIPQPKALPPNAEHAAFIRGLAKRSKAQATIRLKSHLSHVRECLSLHLKAAEVG